MAEYVHQTLEEMIPELEEMNRVGLFTVKETKTILKKREGHEYKLRQLTKTKESFLNYIEYETKLLELLKFRRKKTGQENLKKGIEKSITDRIHKLYRLLTTRFPECVQFWEMHIEFSKQLNEKAYVTRLYEQVLKLHARNEELWVKAARWESSPEGNANQHQARTVLLKGQRTNPESEVIFLQMFLLELQLAKKVVKRKNILGLTEEEPDENKEEEIGSEFKLAEIVYRNGLDLFPDRPEIHLKLLNICCSMKEATSLQEKIVSDLQYMYPDNPQVWNALALRHLNSIKTQSKEQVSEALARCVKVYEQTLENLQTEEMWSLALTAFLNLLALREAGDSSWLLPKTLTLFERALQLGTISEDVSVSLVELLTDLGMTDDLLEVTSRLTDLHPSSARLWLTRMRQEAKHDGKNVVEGVLNKALKLVPAEESWPLWELALNLCAAHKTEALETLMERACRSVCPHVCLPAKEWSLHWTYTQGGLKGLRNVYKSLRVMRPVSLGFYQTYIRIEAAQLEPDLKRLRSAFEEACVEFGATETDLWLNYIQMEREVGRTDSKGGVVYQRAGQSLKPELREAFIRKHALVGVAA